MTDFKKAFIDTAPFIYFIEKDGNNPLYHEKVKGFFISGCAGRKEFVTSAITLEEYFVFPYRHRQYSCIEMFYRLVAVTDMKILAVNQEIAKKAAQIRAEYRGFKAMDALQLAAARVSGCDMFLTNDKQLKQFRDVMCITVDEL